MECVDGAPEFPAAGFGVAADAGVVARGHSFGADLARGGQQADRTSRGCCRARTESACGREIIVDEWANYGLLELPLEVDHVVREAEMLGDAAGVVDIVKRAAALADRLVGPSSGRRR